MSQKLALPNTAPFTQDEISALDRVITGTSATQRAWLAGFLAGVDAAAGQPLQAAPLPAAPPAVKPKLLILYATESGNTEALAGRARAEASKRGFAARTLDMADADIAALKDAGNLLVIASTWGEGDPPQRAVPFFRALMAEDAPKLDGVNFAVLALGDSAYVQFCEIGKRIDARLAELGAARVAERVDCDLDYEAPAGDFISSILTTLTPAQTEEAQHGDVIHVDFNRGAAAATKDAPFAAEITAHHPLSSSRSSSQTLHVALDLEGSGLAYEPGDSLGIIPENDPALVGELLAATGLDGDDDAVRSLTFNRDITTLTGKMLTEYAALTGDPSLAALAGDEAQRKAFVESRQPVDLFEAFPHKFTEAQLTRLLRPLPPRYYSIASSQKLVGAEAHLAIAKLAYESGGRQRLGVASGMVAERRRLGEQLRVFVKPNQHFRLPHDKHTPIVMIGAGTGIAPYRAFLQERDATDATGKSWLIFGHRHFLHDFLYQLDIQDWLKRGVLGDVDLAFSRDQPEKRYVQTVLWEQRAKLLRLLDQGAVLYLCGDATHMARDVEATLIRILGGGESTQDWATQDWAAKGQAAVDALITAGRYKKDVY
jgi:sulfite reductase (NADPH) flavoprotein alpha-component